MVSWVGITAGLAVVVGLFCSAVWARLVRLPAYVVQSDHVAVMAEGGHTEIFAADAWFVVIGLVGGLLLGALSWSWFRSLGWPVVLIALGAGLLGGGVCWAVGQLWGPGAFDVRLAHASPGDSVTVAFQLHTPVALAAWGLGAVAPSLLLAALGPEQGARQPDGGPRGRSRAAEPTAESAAA